VSDERWWCRLGDSQGQTTKKLPRLVRHATRSLTISRPLELLQSDHSCALLSPPRAHALAGGFQLGGWTATTGCGYWIRALWLAASCRERGSQCSNTYKKEPLGFAKELRALAVPEKLREGGGMPHEGLTLTPSMSWATTCLPHHQQPTTHTIPIPYPLSPSPSLILPYRLLPTTWNTSKQKPDSRPQSMKRATATQGGGDDACSTASRTATPAHPSSTSKPQGLD
jgi:hypothetical protein